MTGMRETETGTQANVDEGVTRAIAETIQEHPMLLRYSQSDRKLIAETLAEAIVRSLRLREFLGHPPYLNDNPQAAAFQFDGPDGER